MIWLIIKFGISFNYAGETNRLKFARQSFPYVSIIMAFSCIILAYVKVAEQDSFSTLMYSIFGILFLRKKKNRSCVNITKGYWLLSVIVYILSLIIPTLLLAIYILAVFYCFFFNFLRFSALFSSSWISYLDFCNR